MPESSSGKALGRNITQRTVQGGEQPGAILLRIEAGLDGDHAQFCIVQRQCHRLECCFRFIGLFHALTGQLALAAVNHGNGNVIQGLAILVAQGGVGKACK